MAKTLKQAAGSAAKIAGMEPVKLDRLVASINRARQKKDDATTEHASIWKEAKDAGCHTEALKLALKLDKMEDDKRNDFLRSFDQLRGHLGLNRALDMFDLVGAEVRITVDADAPEPAATAAEWEGNDAPFDVDQQPGESGEEVILAAGAEDEQQEEVAAEPETAADWRDAEIAADEMPDDAGAIFNSAAEHRRLGGDIDDNPHPAATSKAIVWARGWKHADAELSEAAETAAADVDETSEELGTDDDLEADVAAAEAALTAEPPMSYGEPLEDAGEAEEAAAQPDNVRPFPAPAAAETEEKPKRRRAAAASKVEAPVVREDFQHSVDGVAWTV